MNWTSSKQESVARDERIIVFIVFTLYNEMYSVAWLRTTMWRSRLLMAVNCPVLLLDKPAWRVIMPEISICILIDCWKKKILFCPKNALCSKVRGGCQDSPKYKTPSWSMSKTPGTGTLQSWEIQVHCLVLTVENNLLTIHTVQCIQSVVFTILLVHSAKCLAPDSLFLNLSRNCI
jgi:hypothetical protein